MSDDFMQRIVALREGLNFPFIIPSAYRCPSHNQLVSETGLSGPHTTGKAIDVLVSGLQAHHLLKAAFLIDMKGVGVNQKGKGRFIHLDDLTPQDGFPRAMVWSY
jgi:uncharacterized protein YcbK (DUF882 family)